WCRRTNGILGRGERARYTAGLVFTTAGLTPRLILAKAGVRGSGPDPSELTPPDTEFARDVLEACAEIDPMLVDDGYHGDLYGRALGMGRRIECDDEALFAACILHDYGLHDTESNHDRCFTLVGADVAKEVLATSRLSEADRHDVLDAMCLHLNPKVTPEQGKLQHLVHD